MSPGLVGAHGFDGDFRWFAAGGCDETACHAVVFAFAERFAFGSGEVEDGEVVVGGFFEFWGGFWRGGGILVLEIGEMIYLEAS